MCTYIYVDVILLIYFINYGILLTCVTLERITTQWNASDF
jgi:hypothetical protein